MSTPINTRNTEWMDKQMNGLCTVFHKILPNVFRFRWMFTNLGISRSFTTPNLMRFFVSMRKRKIWERQLNTKRKEDKKARWHVFWSKLDGLIFWAHWFFFQSFLSLCLGVCFSAPLFKCGRQEDKFRLDFHQNETCPCECRLYACEPRFVYAFYSNAKLNEMKRVKDKVDIEI